jgi:FOG: EAL domain
LKNLKVDFLKIDGAFIRDLPKSPTDLAMVKSMHQIAHALGLKTIAEYVENPATLAMLERIGVDYAQGHAIEPAIALDALALETLPPVR